MTLTDPDPDFRPIPGTPDDLGPGLRRVLAPNPSPMTFRGTNTYIVGEGDVAVIDPGPPDPVHLEAILAALAPGERVSHIVVTHAHLDHAPLARPLSDRTGAPVIGFGDARAGRSAAMQALAATGEIGGGEGVDHAFTPDITVSDGMAIEGKGWRLDVLHTPGHFGNHIALAQGDTLFTGDLVMGWASSLVSPPDGDLTDFMASCRRLSGQGWRRFLPGHGAPVDTPDDRLDWLIRHRETREAQIREALATAPGSALDLAERIYTDTPAPLLGAASRNVLAHLIDLVQKNHAAPEGPLHHSARFRLL